MPLFRRSRSWALRVSEPPLALFTTLAQPEVLCNFLRDSGSAKTKQDAGASRLTGFSL